MSRTVDKVSSEESHLNVVIKATFIALAANIGIALISRASHCVSF